MRILVAYTTYSGSTEGVARAIAGELGRSGGEVDILRLEEVSGIASYDAAVVGAPMIMGWRRSAVAFVKKHRDALSRMPVAYFFTAMSLTQTGETRVGTAPICVDPALAKPPRQAQRLSLRERYATASNYLGPVLKAVPSVKPVSVAILGGKLELFRLKIVPMLFVMTIVQAQPGDFRNWPFIQEWAKSLVTSGAFRAR